MGVANNTRKIFIGGRRGAKSKAARAAKQGRPPPTRKAPTPPKKPPTAAKKAKQAAKQKAKTQKAAANKKAGLKRQEAVKAGKVKRKSKSEKRANKAAKKTAKKAAKKKNTTKKNPKKKDKKGSPAPSILGGPLGALGDAFKALADGLAAAAAAAAATAAALADALSDMFSGASDMGEGFGEGASSGANITGSNSNGNCSPEAQAAKSAADLARSTALKDYDPEKSGSLNMLIAADKVWKAAMIKAKITGTCEGDPAKNAENSPKENSAKEAPSPSIATAKDMDDNTFAKAWAGAESVLGLVPPIKSTDKFKPIQERIMKKIKTNGKDVQTRKDMYIAMRFLIDPANIHRKFRKPSVLNAKVVAKTNANNSDLRNPVNSPQPVESNTNSKYMTEEELKAFENKSKDFLNTAEALTKVGDSTSEQIIKEIPREELKKMSDVNLANLIKTKLYDHGLDDNDKVWPDNFSKFWADAEYILGFKIKESDTYYDIQKKVSLRKEMFSNEIYDKIKEAIGYAEIFITEHHYFFRKFRKQMYVGNYKNTIHKTKEQIKNEMSYLKEPPPQS